ncbi:MAG: CHAD domain-containing protein [Thermoleophilaceae bacterium]|nr:CHAD domain-containing protein [Thermoleophilaceae bacterium]
MNLGKRRSDEAVAELLIDQLTIVRANVDGAIAGDDPEALHDLRVAVRRSRTLLKGMPGVFTPADHERFTRELRELQLITGPVRDYDVLLEDLECFIEERPELASESEALRKELMRRRSAARAKLARRLKSKRFADLLDAWQATIEALPTTDESDRPDSRTPIGKLSAARIDADRKRFKKLSADAVASGDPAAVHHARKRGKALRYNLEFFGHLGDKKRSKRLGNRLRKTQDELGAYQDTVVHEAALREAAESAGSVAVAIAAGAMIERALDERDYRLEQFERRVARRDKQ